MSYRNIYFDRKKSIIHHWTHDEDGNRIKKEVSFKPYVYVAAASPKHCDGIGIDGVPLIKKEFEFNWERTKFVNSYKGKVYFDLPPSQQYLLEKYYDSSISDLTKHTLRTFFIDIEVIADEFPTASEAKFPITSMTLYDTDTKKYYVWGIKKYNVWSIKDHLKDFDPEDVVYTFCNGERDLLVRFLRYWRANFPDVVVGYNSSSFDIPYIVNRIEQVFGEGKSSKLSPVDNIYAVDKENKKFGQIYKEYNIGGISHIDYLLLYKTFTPGERESDSLDYVSWEELGFGKLEHDDMSFRQFADTQWDKFINYNIFDVKLLVLLDEKKRYLEIAKFSAFSGFCNLDKAFGKTAIITGVLAKQSLQKGRIIPTQSNGKHGKIPGGYVKKPLEGLYEDVISVDANSLYPSCMITLNISPESKRGKVISRDGDNLTIFLFKEKCQIQLNKKNLKDFLKERNWAVSGSFVFFDQTEKSISAQFVDDLYQKRKSVQGELKKLNEILNNLSTDHPDYKRTKFQSDQLDTEQYLYKTLLNSTYGAFANRFFSLYDIDCAKAITTTGQAMIKETERIVNSFIVSNWDVPEKDYVVGMDTDSALFTINEVCSKFGYKLIDENGDLTPEFIQIETELTTHLNKEIKKWAIDKLNSQDPRFFFKRESVCPKAIWAGKKHYILYLVNKEGKKMNKFKYSGLAIAKSTWSAKLKDISKGICETIMLNKNKKEADQKIFDFFDRFSDMAVNDIAERASIKVLNKWDDKNNGLITAKGTTQNAKYAITYNELLKELHLDNKYRKIENGSKIKKVLLQDNKYNLDGIAYQDALPSDFGLKVDYEQMFFKGVLKCLQPIYDAMTWKIPDPRKQYEYTLEEIFG